MKACIRTIIGLTLALFASCAKEKELNHSDCEIVMSNVAGTYRITAVKYKSSPADAEIDFLDSYYTDPCEADDLIILHANGTAELKDVGLTCSPLRDDTGNWSLNGNTLSSDNYVADIESLICGEYMVLVISDIMQTGDKLRITYSRQ